MHTEAHAQYKKENGAWYKSPYAVLIIGHAIGLFGWILFAAIAWGKLSEQFKEEAKWRGEMTEWRLQVSRDGTDNFKYGRYDERLKVVEEATKKNDAILKGLDRVEADVKELKASQHK